MRTRKFMVLVALTMMVSMLTLGSGQPLVMADDGKGSSGKFLLGGTAKPAQDPENPANDVIRISTVDAPLFGTVSRQLNVKIQTLDNMLEAKWYFVAPKTCIGGSPRYQLAIDLNGDGKSDGNAFGYFGPPVAFTGCPSNSWMYTALPFPATGGTEDLTDEELRWDLSQFANDGLPVPAFVVPWSVVETLVGAFPKHNVCAGALVDDTFGAPGMSGIAFYDLITIGRATLANHEDIGGRGFARCKDDQPRSDGDDDDD